MADKKIVYVNKEYVDQQAQYRKPLKEISGFYKGSIASVLTFIATNKAAVFLGGCAEDEVMYWFGQQVVLHPELKGLITFAKGVVQFSWNAIVADPLLVASIISGAIALGATVVWGIKRHKLKKKIVKEVAKANNADEAIVR